MLAKLIFECVLILCWINNGSRFNNSWANVSNKDSTPYPVFADVSKYNNLLSYLFLRNSNSVKISNSNVLVIKSFFEPTMKNITSLFDVRWLSVGLVRKTSGASVSFPTKKYLVSDVPGFLLEEY